MICSFHVKDTLKPLIAKTDCRVWSSMVRSRHDFFYSVHFLPFTRNNQNIHPLFWSCLSLTVY